MLHDGLFLLHPNNVIERAAKSRLVYGEVSARMSFVPGGNSRFLEKLLRFLYHIVFTWSRSEWSVAGMRFSYGTTITRRG